MFIRKLMLLAAVSLSLLQNAVAEEDAQIVERIDAQVRANAQWTQEAEQCPADLMPARRALEINVHDCNTADQLDGCLTLCTAGDAYSCLRTAVTLQQLGGDPASFEPLYQRACKLGATSGCTNHAAGLYRADMQNERVQACAARSFTRACDQDDPWACTMYGMYLARGIGVKKDLPKALEVLKKSCKHGEEDPACSNALQLGASIRKALDEAKPAD
ncbi:tetratricopeptide repeat protein [Pseudomonas sp. PDM13]|uniref:tetratricopeptide repeat protein n=1 Tax=Pseudomonas sp. PDM13 TaxID=2769255 RepID=UPI0021DF76B9|nr:sel1 repeat family protein [Pseudomonas sp. PDM13]MCU9948490.1 sel1 repeat family protein [Pseudomonas sp. PDM13]